MSVWALGDYSRVADEVLAGLGRELVAACAVAPGRRVLDVGAGAGNVAIPAAEAGATVVASDPTPELLEAGRRAASARDVEIEWIDAGAEALPFGDDSFDIVLSCVGAIFAPDHRAAADELLRTCRPGGTIGMVNWMPGGWSAEFFEVFAPYTPPRPPEPSPMDWGREEHVRELFGDRVESLQLDRAALRIDSFATPADLCAFYKANFGPVVATYAALAPDEVAALDRDFLAFATRTNRGGPDGPAGYDLGYLRVVARTAR
jgi:SAM-dependent methyltransferase